MSSTSVSENRPQLSIIARPQGQLHDYPIDVRWEVTRRHPYYLVFWEDALKYRKEPSGDWSSPETWRRYAAMLMLGNIGVWGEPVPPETDARQLNEGVPDPAFLTGSVQPLSIRGIVAMLINGLPPPELVRIGQLLSNAGSNALALPDDDENRNLQKQLALGDLARLPSPILNDTFAVPLFYVQLGASQRSIVRDMEDQARRWKERREIGSSKVQTAKLDEYVKVWDHREGWTGRGYDRSKELKFKEIARHLKTGSISTVANRYRSAFEMITGHPFNPELWWQLFGRLRYSKDLGNPATSFASPVLRHLRSPLRRPVPESGVGPLPDPDQAHPVGLVEGLSAIPDHVSTSDLLMDIEDLLKRGLSDPEIAQKLDLEDPALVADYRSRAVELESTMI